MFEILLHLRSIRKYLELIERIRTENFFNYQSLLSVSASFDLYTASVRKTFNQASFKSSIYTNHVCLLLMFISEMKISGNRTYKLSSHKLSGIATDKPYSGGLVWSKFCSYSSFMLEYIQTFSTLIIATILWLRPVQCSAVLLQLLFYNKVLCDNRIYLMVLSMNKLSRQVLNISTLSKASRNYVSNLIL